MTGDIEHSRPGIELFLKSEGIVVFDKFRERYCFLAVCCQVSIEVTKVNSLHGAGLNTGWQFTISDIMYTEDTFTHRPLLLWHRPFRARLGDTRGHGRWGIPVKIAGFIGTGGHAHPTADAYVLVNQYYTVVDSIGGPYRTDLETGRILALHAETWQIVLLTRGTPGFIHLDPFLLFGQEMHFLAGLGAMIAAITAAEVDDHCPLPFGQFLISFRCLDLLTTNTKMGNSTTHAGSYHCCASKFKELPPVYLQFPVVPAIILHTVNKHRGPVMNTTLVLA